MFFVSEFYRINAEWLFLKTKDSKESITIFVIVAESKTKSVFITEVPRKGASEADDGDDESCAQEPIAVGGVVLHSTSLPCPDSEGVSKAVGSSAKHPLGDRARSDRCRQES